MSDTPQTPADNAQNGAQDATQGPGRAQTMPITFLGQYVRDMSFENPNAPQALRAGQSAPEMDININVDVRPMDDKDMGGEVYEAVLKLRATAKRQDKPVFLAEVEYAVVALLERELPGHIKQQLLYIEAPRMAFPFARQILSDMTQQGGYPPLLLAPVDFTALYIQQAARNAPEGMDAETAVRVAMRGK